MWKLPMFGCTDASQVLNEVNECKKAYPDCYVRLAAFDSVKQVQVMSFVVQKPGQTAASSSTSYWAMAGTTGEKDMKVWTPIDNQKFETFSYLPPGGGVSKLVRSLGKISGAAACCGMLRHASACTCGYLRFCVKLNSHARDNMHNTVGPN